jgi:uncharacterized protein
VNLRVAACAGLLAIFCSPAWAQEAPSFDCSRAHTAVERALCAGGNSGMGWLDQTMSNLYQGALKGAGPQADTMRASQRSWLVRRNRCGGPEDKIMSCLDQSYRARFAQIAASYDSSHVTGRYANKIGTLDAVLFPDQSLAVSINASLGAPSYNQCNLTFQAPLRNGKVSYVFPADSADVSQSRCSLEMKQSASGFVVQATHCADRCGYGVPVAGAYER